MAILSRDGKVYTLQSPNPIVEKQVAWDRSSLVFHNFEWEDILQRVGNAQKKPAPVVAVPNPNPIPTESPPPPEQKDDEPTVKQQAPPEKNEFELPHIKYRVLCHCLPAKVENRRDELYGETWTRTTYGTKFVFPCVVMSSTDLSLEFWTSDPRSQISEKSVVYPFSYEVYNQEANSYDMVPYDDYRWWRITSKEKKEGGWLFQASPSDHQPDFSD